MSFLIKLLSSILSNASIFRKKLTNDTQNTLKRVNKLRIRHLNTGSCPKCKEIMEKYPDLNSELIRWFTNFQKIEPLAHISCAGRGKSEQEDALKRKVSKAAWGESPHNYNMAVDIFKVTHGGEADWSRDWFVNKLQYAIKMHPNLAWGGDWSSFKDFPHVELKDWKKLVKSNKIKLVE